MMPTYNPKDYIFEALESVLKQYPDDGSMQLEIIDDCSTKVDIPKIIEKIDDKRISYYRNPKNVGHSFNFTEAVRKSRGHLVHILHDDDLVKPGFYETFAKIFEEYKEVGAAYCRQEYIDDDGKTMFFSEPDLEKTGILDNALIKLAEKQRVQYCAMVVRRSAYEKVGGYVMKNIGCEDWEMWVRIASQFDIAYEPEALAKYRIHTTSMTLTDMQSGQDMRFLREAAEIFTQYVPEDKREEVTQKRNAYYGNYSFENAKKLYDKFEDKRIAAAQLTETIQLDPQLVLANTLFLEQFDVPVKGLGVSVLICTHNDEDSIERTLRHLIIQRVPEYIPWEVIISDAGSTDNTIAKSLETWKIFGGRKDLNIISSDCHDFRIACDEAIKASKYEYILFCNPGEFMFRDYIHRASTNMLNDYELSALSGYSEAILPEHAPSWFDTYKKSVYQIGELSDHTSDTTWSNGFVWNAGMVLRKAAWTDLKKKGFKPFNIDHAAESMKDVFNREFFSALRSAGWRMWYSVELRLRKEFKVNDLKWSNILRYSKFKSIEDLHLMKFAGLSKTKRVRRFKDVHGRIELRREIRGCIRKLKRIRYRKKKIYPEFIPGDKDSLTVHACMAVLSELLPAVGPYNRRLRMLRRYSSKNDLFLIHQVADDFYFRYPAFKKANDRRGVTVAISYSGSSPAYLKECLRHVSDQKTPSDLPWEVLVISSSLDNFPDTRLKLLNFWERTNCNANLRILDTNAIGSAERANIILDNMRYDSCVIMNEFNQLEEDYVRIAYRLIRTKDGVGMFSGTEIPVLPVRSPTWFEKKKELFDVYPEPSEAVDIFQPEAFLRHNPAVLRKSALRFLCKQLISLKNSSNSSPNELIGVLATELTSWGSSIRFEPRLKSKRYLPIEVLKWSNVRQLSFNRGYQNALAYSADGFIKRSGVINKELSLLFQKPFRKILSSKNEYRNDTEILEIETILGRIRRVIDGNGEPISVNGSAGISATSVSAVIQGNKVQDNAVRKGVSVVVCCFNSSRVIQKTLQSIFKQNVPSSIPWEVIIVDNKSIDGTSDIVRKIYESSCFMEPFQIVHEYEQGLSSARRRGIETSKYEYVIFCDDDNRLERDFVKRAFERMESDEFIGVLGGQSRAQFDDDPPYWFKQWQNSFAIGEQHTKEGNITYSKGYVWGASMVVRKSAWNKILKQGFHSALSDRKGDSLSSGGDTEICYSIRNAGYKIYYDPKLRFAHYMPSSRMKWNYVERLFSGFGMASFGLDRYRKAFAFGHDEVTEGKIYSRKYEIRKAMSIFRRENYRRLIDLKARKEGMSDVPMVEYTIGRIVSIARTDLSRDSSTHLLKRALRKCEQRLLKDSLKKTLKDFPKYPRTKLRNGVSVVICTFNGESRLPQTLSFIAKQKTDPNLLWEVILVDNASTDNTKQASIDEWSKHKCNARLRIVDEPTPGLSSARHKGFKTAKYNYIALCDDDNWIDENFVQLTYEIMNKDKSIGILGGPNEPQFDDKPPEWFSWFQQGFATGEQWDFKTNRISEGDVTWKRGFVWGAGMILRKAAVDELYSKGFTSLMQDRKGYHLSSGGDSELCYALVLSGWKVWYDRRLTCYHMMPSGRITWNYLIRLFQGFGITSVGLDPYEKAIQLGRADIIEKEILIKNWRYEFSQSLKELRKAGIRNVLRVRLPQDNNTKVPMIEYHLFRLQELWRVRKNYDKKFEEVRNSAWRKNNKELRKQHRKFVETENDFRYGWPWTTGSDSGLLSTLNAGKLPKISVLSPSFNSENTIEKAILSVLNQRYPNFEHIICDGGSTDNTVNIIRKYPHIKWVSEPDEGQCDAMNKAFSMATGDVIVYLNVDDYFQRNAFLQIAKAFEENPEADIVVGNLFFDENEHVYRRDPEIEYLKILQPFKYIFPINPVCYFYKRNVQVAAGPFPLDNHFTMDYWFLLKAYQHAKIVKISYNLGTFWMNGLNKTSGADNRKNVHKTAVKHLLENDRKNLPFYLSKYYKHYYYDSTPYNLKKIRYKLRKNLSRVYSVITMKKNRYYSNKLYKEARSTYYLNKRLRSFSMMLFSFTIYPKGIKQRSKQSLTIHSMFNQKTAEKLKFMYFFFTTPPGVPLGNKIDYFGRKFYEEGRRTKGRALLMLSYLASPKFLLDEDYIYKPVRNQIFGTGPLRFINPLNWTRSVYSFFKNRKNRVIANKLCEISGVSYNANKRFKAAISVCTSFVFQPGSINTPEKRALLYYSLLGENQMGRLNTLYGIYKNNPENTFAHKLNYYGNQQRKEGNTLYGNSLLMLTYLLSPKYIKQREKITSGNIVYSSQKVEFKVKAGNRSAEHVKSRENVLKILDKKNLDLSKGIGNNYKMSKFRIQLAYDYFRYRKFKAKSKYLYSDAMDFYHKGEKSKVPGLIIPSFLYYPPSLLNRNKWSLLINSVISESTLKKVKGGKKN